MGDIVGGLFGEGPKQQVIKGGDFQPFTYESLLGSARGEKDGDGFKFSQELSPELQALYGAGLAQSQPFLSQYLSQAGAPVAGFDTPAFDVRDRERQIFQEQAALLEPTFAQQRQQLQGDLFGSGRLGLKIAGEGVGAGAGGMVNPDAFGLARAQSLTTAELAPEARRMAQAEQQQAFDQARLGYGLNQAAQQQQLANLLSGYGTAFGTVKDVRGLESDLIGQAAGLEEARARTKTGATTQTQGSGGLFGAALGAGLSYATGGMGGGGGFNFGGLFSSPMSYGSSGSIFGYGGAGDYYSRRGLTSGGFA